MASHPTMFLPVGPAGLAGFFILGVDKNVRNPGAARPKPFHNNNL